MTIRRPNPSDWKSQNRRKRRLERLKRQKRRQPRLEALEARQLLAVGPQLAGIQPNDGALLRNGQVRNIAPEELVFHFNDGAAIDETTVDGIRLTRSGGDGTFAKASATSDFNTDGGVIIDFDAVATGQSGNGISISVIKNAQPNRPLVSVLGSSIEVQLNTTTGTTADELVDAINSHTQARTLVRASIRSGFGSTNIAEPAINYSPIVTGGANAASAITNLNVGNSLQMTLTANQAGAAGLGIDVTIERRDFGGVASPRISVTSDADGDLIAIEVNSNSADPTTAGELVAAINAHPQASALLTATLSFGSPDTVVGTRVTGINLSLSGIADIPVTPGFLGLGDSTRQVVMRFAEPLPDDIYHVEIIGAGALALRNVDGGAFGDRTDDNVDDGSGFSLTFELDLGAQVLAVVPQPVTRNPVTNILAQFRDRIHVYFNDDDLHPQSVTTGQVTPNPTVVDPAFYQLIFTNDTVQNTDDVVYQPVAIQYDPDADLAVLVFDEPLDELGSGPGTFRLRVGTDETAPLAPFTGTAGFATASSPLHTIALPDAFTNPAQVPSHANSLVNIDGTIVDQASLSFRFRGLTPGADYEVFVFGGDANASSSSQDVTITGAGTPVAFTQAWAGNQLVNRQASSNADLSTFAESITANGSGEIAILVDATTAADYAAVPALAIRELDATAQSAPALVGIDFGPSGDTSPANWNHSDGNGGTDFLLTNLVDETGSRTGVDLSVEFNMPGAVTVDFTATKDFANRVTVEITSRDFNGPGTPLVSVVDQHVVVELNSNATNRSTADDLVNAINGNAQAVQLLTATISSGDGTTEIPTAAAATNLTLAGLGSSFDTATNLGTLVGQSQNQVLSAAIDPQPFGLDFPGDLDEPGHRDLRPEVQQHFLEGFSVDSTDGVPTAFYNFLDEYGFDPQGNILHNAITEAQKQRTREIFSLYSAYLGINFVETTQDLGMTIVTGDLRAIDAQVTPGPGGVIGLACTSPPIKDSLLTNGRYACPIETNGSLDGIAIMDLQDFSDPSADIYGGSWFQTAMHEIGHLLGMGHTDELPLPTILNGQLSDPSQPATGHPLDFSENTAEPVFPGDHDVVHGQFLYSPDSKDIDLFTFRLPESGTLSIETFAERLPSTSMLDTLLSLYRQESDGTRSLIARNDDYFSNDSFLEMALPAGTYWVGVTASGNDDFDPIIDDTGLGGRTQGDYDIRINFRPSADRSILDATGVPLDGDADGVPGGVYNTWFRAQDAVRTIFVDKAATGAENGTLSAPYTLISTALLAAQPGDVVRIVANGGADRNVVTTEDNRAYEIGFNRLGSILADGSTLEVPRGVTVMIDSGAIIKMRRARIGVGSSSSVVDRSAGALQVLGAPVLLDPFGRVLRDALGEPIPGSVYFTSIHDEDLGTDTNPDSFRPPPAPGDWGGLLFQRDVDKQDASRFDYEDQGIFLNVVSNADIRYGGGNVVIDGVAQVVTPIHITEARPTISFNEISSSADAAISASPDSFEETNFHSPPFQFTAHTADYARIGPDLFGNRAVDNSINGIFVRVKTPAGDRLQPLTVPARLDDTDLPYVLTSRLVVQGTPGGYELDIDTPTVQLVTLNPTEGGSLAAGDYNYRVVFVDAAGNEGVPSSATANVTIAPNSTVRSVRLENLPVAPAGFIARRIYRSDSSATTAGAYLLVAEINVNNTSFVDTGSSLGRQLTPSGQGTLRARLDARLAVDPGVIMKLNAGGIETTLGGDFYAEGVDGREIIFTSLFDDRFGGGGSFDTTNDLDQVVAEPGNWGGIRAGQTGSFSLDSALVAYGGGVVDIEGTFAGFNAVELHQAEARIANSLFDSNGPGTGGQAGFRRAGRGFNRDAAIFVRGSQPVVVSNDIINNEAPAISIDANSLNSKTQRDPGRSTYSATAGVDIDQQQVALDNQGPLVRLNRLTNNNVNAMRVRGGTLTTEGVWDDTDIVHALIDESVNVADFHTFGGLRLESSATESLVVKLSGDDAGFTATGLPLEISDRIGGALQIVGQPSHPVVLTSLQDDSVGAGFEIGGAPQLDTNNDAGAVDTGPTFGPEVDNGTLIDNDLLVTDLGHFEVDVQAGGGSGLASTSGVTVQGLTQTVQNADFIFEYINYVDPGGDGQAVDLSTTNITMPPTLIAPDLVVSEGDFQGATGTVAWRMESTFVNGSTQFTNTLTLTSQSTNLGNLRFITYLDEDVIGFTDDILYPVGTPGAPDFRAFTLDGPERFGFSHGGIYVPGPGLANATYDGWAADQYNDLQNAITQQNVAPATYSVPGNINLQNLPQQVDPDLGAIFGPADVTTAFAWSVDPNATTATITSFLELVPQDPSATGPSLTGDWRSVRLEEYSHDRNVETIIEQEPAEAAAPGINATTTSAQVIGNLARNEKTSDENIRLGFEVHGSLTAPDDVDVYAFSGFSGTEVWLDIDNTKNSLDTVVELLDAAGNVLARSDNAAAESADPSLLYAAPQMGQGRVNPLSKAGYDPNNPAQASSLAISDRYSTNPGDAGMRVILPGQPGAATTYHVRVRSSSADLTKLDGGLTSGNYQLQLRLRELDEVPGSTVRFSDIRFAENGIEVFGQPTHSPLLGEATEIESFDPLTSTVASDNSVFVDAQEIGNVLQTDRGVISLSGNIFDPDDVDFYRLEVIYDSVQPSPPNFHMSTIFDIDYADGLARTNTALWVFDSDGKLILTSKGSNIADDRPRALQGDDIEDLTRGSVGVLDPYIGPVELQAGPRLNPDSPPPQDPTERGVYFVAVSSNAQMPEELRQYLEPNPPNPFVRLEPVNSVRRIAEDDLSGFGATFTDSRIAEPPEVPILVDEDTSVVPFTLGDVTLFVTNDDAVRGGRATSLHYVDPFTGALEATAGDFREPIADVALRGDGNLFAFTVGSDGNNGPVNDSTVGTYVQIDPGDATATKLSDDGVETNVHNRNAASPGAERAPIGNDNSGVGIFWDAITFESRTNRQFDNGYVVGSRGRSTFSDTDPDQNAVDGIDFAENTLFHFDINNGVVANVVPSLQNRMNLGVLQGAGTQKIEIGEVLSYTRITPGFPGIGDTYTISINGKSISYTSQGSQINIGNNVFVLQGTQAEVVGGLAAAWRTAALSIPEFAAFEVLNSPGQVITTGFTFGFPDALHVRLIDPAFAQVDIVGSFTRGSVGSPSFAGSFFFTPDIDVDGFGPGGKVKGIDFVNGQMYAVTDRGGLYQVDTFGFGSLGFGSSNVASYVRSSAIDLMTADNGQPIEFAGLTAGPPNVAGGRYAELLFGISTDGDIYAFNTRGELQPIFVDNQTSVSTGLFQVNGLEFSHLDENLWHLTTNRGADPGHGTFGPADVNGDDITNEPFDNSRRETLGGSSIYFGAKTRGEGGLGGNQTFSNTAFIRDFNFPGGAHGSVITNPFSLEGYSSSDLPTLYFNYFLETEDSDFDPAPSPDDPTRDALRVFVSDDNGEWTLLATNNNFQDAVRGLPSIFGSLDEFDIGESFDPNVLDFDTLCQFPANVGTPCVQPLWDNTDDWRQARIPLDRYAGRDNIRLRFDFSSAGSMNLGDTFTVGSELRTVDGAQLRDGDTFAIDGNNRLEFDFGYTLAAPNGAAIQDGDSFTVSPSPGRSLTFEFDEDTNFTHNIAVQAGRAYRDGETFTVSNGSQTETLEFDSGSSILVPGAGANVLQDAETFEVDGVTFEFDDDGTFSGANNIVNLIVDQSLQIPASGGAGLTDGQRFTINDGSGGPDLAFEFDDDDDVPLGTRAVDITNIEIQIPIAGASFGGIQDGDSFTVSDGAGGIPFVFEFDKNNSVGPGSRVIVVSDSSSQSEVVNAIITALQASGLGLNPQDRGGGVIRLGVFRHNVDTSNAPTIDARQIDATADEIADRLVDIILNAGLGLTPVNTGNGVIRLGSTTHVVSTVAAPSVSVQFVRGNQDDMATEIVKAINNAGLSLSPVNLGTGEVFLGVTTSLDTSGTAALGESGSPGLTDINNTAIVFSPTMPADQVAAAIATAVSSALSINALANGNVVEVPIGVSFSPDGTALTPANVASVAFSADTSASGIASNIEDALRLAFQPVATTVDLAAAETNDRFATATDTGITGGAASFQASGTIGDNFAFPFERGLDVDFVRMDLQSGDNVTITASTPNTGGFGGFGAATLQPALKLYNPLGIEIASASTATFFGGFGGGGFGFTPAPPQIDFTAVVPGTYYVAVSSTANLDYDPRFAGSADVTLQIPSQGGAIGGLTDGETFTITDRSTNTTVLFEFDNNGIVDPTATVIGLDDLVMAIPQEGVAAGGIRDGDTFIINDNEGSGDVVFEFDTEFLDPFNLPRPIIPNVSPGAIPILLDPDPFFGDTAATIATKVSAEISSANLGLSPSTSGTNTVQLGTANHTIDISGTPRLSLFSVPRTQAEIVSLLTEAIRKAGLALAPTAQVFSFTNFFGGAPSFFTTGGIDLDVRDHVIDVGLAPNLTKVIPTNTGAYDLSIEIADPFTFSRVDDRVNLPTAVSVTQSGLPNSFIDGRPGTGTGFGIAPFTVPVNSGMDASAVARATANSIGQSVAGYIDQIVAVGGGQIADGEIFSISDGTVSVNFEFENGYSLQIPDLATDPNAFLDGEFFTIARSGQPTNFEFDDDGIVGLGSIGVRFNDLVLEIPAGGISEDLNQNGVLDVDEDANFNGILDPGEDLNGNGVLDFDEDVNFNQIIDGEIHDGQTFTIDRGPGTPTVVFEFDTDGITGFGNEVISVSQLADEVEVANATVFALNNAGLGLNARVTGRGATTFLGFGAFFTTQADVFIQLGISDHNVDLTLTPGIDSSFTLRTQDEIGELIVTAVGSAGLGMNPTYLGGGQVHLGGDPTHVLDLSNAVTLTSTGLPGVSDPNAIVIPVFPSDTVSASNVSQLILSAINTAQVNQGLTVTAVPDGARRVNLSGQTLITNFTQAPSLPINRSGDTVTTYQNIINVVGHTVTDQGPLGLEEALAGDEFGGFDASGPPGGSRFDGALRGMDNDFEGAYIDDIIIGFAERGEIVTGARENPTFVQNDELFNIELPPEYSPSFEIHVGEYELEVRRAEEFGRTRQDPRPEILLERAFNTNDRLTDATAVTIPAGHLVVEGQTFSLSDGLNSRTFEFDDLAIGDGVTAGSIAIPYRTTYSSTQMAAAVRDAINGPASQAALSITAALADGVSQNSQTSSSSDIHLFGNAVFAFADIAAGSRSIATVEPNDTTFDAEVTGIGTGVSDFTATGTIGDNPNQALVADPAADVDLFAVELGVGQTINVNLDIQDSTLNPVVLVFEDNDQFIDSGVIGTSLQYTAFTAGTHYIGVSGAFNFNYSPFVEGSGVGNAFGGPISTGDYEISISLDATAGFAVTEFTDFGDSNVVREQGQILIHSNRISNSETYGILASAGTRDGSGLAPHVGPARTTREVNRAGLVPGLVIANNVISNNGVTAIFFSGDQNDPLQQAAAIPFGRIVNNTLVGPGTGGTTGVAVVDNASPTILNNIIADFDTAGIVVNNANAVIGGSVYRGNGQDVVGVNVQNATGTIDEGSSPIFLNDTDPLFIDDTTGNYYLAPGTPAIDSSINSLEDRPELVAIRAPLGIGLSPILAPDTDALGQTRVDDPTAPASSGQGSSVFKDRGALDRADFAGPTAVLITPRDNDALGRDSDDRATFVNLTNQIVTDFSIQLLDGVEPNDPQDGTGADDNTVRADRITVFRDDVELEEGVDYKFSYDATNNIIRLTPLAGIWELDRKYDIELSNSRGLEITAPNGTEVVDGDSFFLTDDAGNTAGFEFDSGYVIQVPQTLAIQIPVTGGATIADRDSITVANSDLGTELTFEFDLDGFTTDGNIPIPFTIFSSANEVANAIVAAMDGTLVDVGLSPVNIENFDGRAVHLGTKTGMTVDMSNSSLVTTGELVGIDDGQTFRVDDSTQSIDFEFTSTGQITGTGRPIQFTFDQTNEQIAETIVQTLQAAGLGLNPRYVALSDGLVNVGGQANHVIEVDPLQTNLILTGEPGAAPEWSLRIPTLAGAPDFDTIQDAEEFTITDGTNSVTIELDSDGIKAPDDPDSHPRIVIQFSDGTTVDQLANAIAIALRNGNVGLTPVNAGLGVIRLTGTGQHSVDLENSSFIELGAPGAPANTPVSFQAGSSFPVGVPSRTAIFSEEEMADSIAAAITSAVVDGNLSEVVAVATGVDINIEGVSAVSGLSTSVRSNIVDIAGNALKPNREDDGTQQGAADAGKTLFTITIGSGVDYGDAPNPYPTSLQENGARHEVVGDFFLGSGVDVDFDGQVSVNADGDDNDGFDDEGGVVFNVPFVGGFGGSVTVSASASGFLDAWVDFNQDGDWFDPGEQIFTRQALQQGDNTLDVNVPGSAFSGQTFARFRFSSAGGLEPVGGATDGEVEDYMINVGSNPWHNAQLPLDTTGDGFVVPLDALRVINFINLAPPELRDPQTGAIEASRPAEQAMVDVNGDGFVIAIDVLRVVNCLNNPDDADKCPHLADTNGVQAEGEGASGTVAFGAAATAARTGTPLAELANPIMVDHRVNDGAKATASDDEILAWRRAEAAGAIDDTLAYHFASGETDAASYVDDRMLSDLAERDDADDHASLFADNNDFWT